MQSIRTLVDSIVDYAGLFPPAKLSMEETVANYARDRAGPHRWMLARLALPAGRLDEFLAASSSHVPGPTATAENPWRLSCLVAPAGDEKLRADLENIREFNAGRDGAVVVDAIELKAARPDDIDAALELVPEEIEPYFEIPWDRDPRGFAAALSGTGAGAKIRTGGETPAMFPPPEALARFIAACLGAGVPFKATAGLHHPFRHASATVPGATEFGFVNVFVGAALALTESLTIEELEAVLAETDAERFLVRDDGVGWGDHALDLEQIEEARRVFARSYGSCSFREPVEDLRALGLLPED